MMRIVQLVHIPGQDSRRETNIVFERLRLVVAAPDRVGCSQNGSAGIQRSLQHAPAGYTSL